MKMVIFKELEKYRVTSEENYNAFIRNERKVQKLDDFTSAEEIMEYYCKYFNSKPEDFIIKD